MRFYRLKDGRKCGVGGTGRWYLEGGYGLVTGDEEWKERVRGLIVKREVKGRLMIWTRLLLRGQFKPFDLEYTMSPKNG